MEYKNFFENVSEARIRLSGTVVLYDGQPVEILAIAEHQDGILRAYVRPTGFTEDELVRIPRPDVHQMMNGTVGPYLDKFIEQNPGCKIVRKHLSSPLFSKFRPFELGMCWASPEIYYVERQPNRKTEQGLTRSMILARRLSTDSGNMFPPSPDEIDIFGPEFKSCILGEHPTPYRCLEALSNPRIANKAAAFHRHFALVKGPIDTLFLSYKSNVIGVLPNGDFSKVKLGAEHKYCKEVVEELNLFSSINV